MYSTTVVVVAVGATWTLIGSLLAALMGRRGHSAVAWFGLGTLTGPLAVVLAVDAWRHSERFDPVGVPRTDTSPSAAPGEGGGAGPARVDVLLGYDGSPAAAAAIEAVVTLLHGRLGRLTAATVVPYGRIAEREELAAAQLLDVSARQGRSIGEMEILHGDPAAALRRRAVEGRYDLIAVGARGSGFANAVHGSVASDLAHGGTVPVLVVGALPAAAG